MSDIVSIVCPSQSNLIPYNVTHLNKNNISLYITCILISFIPVLQNMTFTKNKSGMLFFFAVEKAFTMANL